MYAYLLRSMRFLKSIILMLCKHGDNHLETTVRPDLPVNYTIKYTPPYGEH